jgi:hypothetical protein
MRSSFYRTMRRFSQASSSKPASERPFSAASAYSADTDGGSTLPAPLRPKKTTTATNPTVPPSNTQPSTTVKSSTTNNNLRRNSSNQIQPVSTVIYNNAVRANYGSKIGQPPENTRIRNIHENDDKYNDPSVVIETHRF